MNLATIFSKPDPYKFRKLLLRANREIYQCKDAAVQQNTGHTRAELEKLAAEETEREATIPTKNAEKLRAEFVEFERKVLLAEAEASALEQRKAALFEKIRKLSPVEAELSGLIANHANDVATAKVTAAEAQFNIVGHYDDMVSRANLSGVIEFLSAESHLLAARKAALAKCQAELAAAQSELDQIK